MGCFLVRFLLDGSTEVPARRAGSVTKISNRESVLLVLLVALVEACGETPEPGAKHGTDAIMANGFTEDQRGYFGMALVRLPDGGFMSHSGERETLWVWSSGLSRSTLEHDRTPSQGEFPGHQYVFYGWSVERALVGAGVGTTDLALVEGQGHPQCLNYTLPYLRTP